MNKKQTTAIAVIMVIAAILGTLILLSNKPETEHEEHGTGHAEAAKGHDDHEPHAKPAGAHKEEGHHDEAHADAGKITFSDAQLRASGIGIHTAQAARIKTVLKLPGEIRFNEDRTAHIMPRVAGVVEAVPANLGDKVKKGQVLAIIASSAVAEHRSALLVAQRRHEHARTTFDREKKLWEEKISAEQDYLQARQVLQEADIELQKARQQLSALGADTGSQASLNQFAIRAPFAGTVVEKRITVGEAVADDAAIFTVADLSTVWAEVVVSPKDLSTIRIGETATVSATAFDSTATGKVSYVGSLLGEETRTAKVRIIIPNPSGTWRPGLFVNVAVVTGDAQVPVSVSAEALHTLDGRNVVFVQVPGGFMPTPVVTGKSDGKTTEIVEGIKPGTRYAAEGSFVIKSEEGKDSAEHSH